MSGPSTGGRPAVFLDRDGVLTALVERDGLRASPRRALDFQLLPGGREAVEGLHALGFLVFVVTNQPDVARGLLPREELDRMTAALRAAVPVDEIAICAHDDADGCPCRKPKPGMLTDLAGRWMVDLGRSVMVGDSWKDVEAGRSAGCRTILVGGNPGGRAVPDAAAATLADAVALLAAGL